MCRLRLPLLRPPVLQGGVPGDLLQRARGRAPGGGGHAHLPPAHAGVHGQAHLPAQVTAAHLMSWLLELQTRAWLKVPTSAFTFKTLLKVTMLNGHLNMVK